FPMARRSVFARRCERASSKGGSRLRSCRDVRQRLDVADAEFRQIWQIQFARASDVSERIATRRVAVGRRVRHGANTDAVQHDPGDAPERAHLLLACTADFSPSASRMRSVSMSTKRSGIKPAMRLKTTPCLSRISVVGIDETCSNWLSPSSK